MQHRNACLGIDAAQIVIILIIYAGLPIASSGWPLM